MGALGAMGEGLTDPEANPVILYFLALSYLIKSNIQPLTAAHSSSAGSARVSSSSAGSVGTISEGSAGVFSAGSAGAFSAGSAGAFLAGSVGELSASDAFSLGSACAPSAGSVSDVHTSKGKLPVEPVSLARNKRLEGVHRQYVVAELFPNSLVSAILKVMMVWNSVGETRPRMGGGGNSGLRPYVEYKAISQCLC